MNLSIVISDANILIDLANLSLLNVFTSLNCNCYTTDFVFEELNSEQQAIVKQLEKSGKLQIATSHKQDIIEIAQLIEKSSGLSVQDCSVWHFSKKLNALMLTGDRKLRKEAEADNVIVRGVLYIFDELLRQQIIPLQEAIKSLEQLKQNNKRLPSDEIHKRLIEWKKGNLL